MRSLGACGRHCRVPLLLVAAVGLSLAACTTGSADVPAPADLSTGPFLQWTETDFEFESVMFVETTSDGRVVVGGREHGGAFTVRVTEDGQEWAALAVPDGVVPLAADASGDRWALIGAPLGVHNSDAEIFGDVFVTDDSGASWIEATLDSMPDEQLPEYASRSMRVVDVLASGRQIIVAVLSFSTFDLESLLANRGLIPDGMFMAYWTLDDDSVVIEFRRWENDDGAVDEIEVNLAYAELAFSPEQVDAIERHQSDARIHLFGGEGTTLAHQAASDARTRSGGGPRAASSC